MFNEIDELDEFTGRCKECDGEGIVFEPYYGCKVCQNCMGTGEVKASEEYDDEMYWEVA